ncbi:hypothetical protein [Pseudoalteromonas sp. KAN5]|uniref:hypothetical protein n=1 Tax=Pseudoalteromonas sp. KAN5 TaxID=2916633 RepID=UPI001FCB44FF|nr:hypothetical protein [Pseudoalteromonas sp. KAN5]
MLPTTQPTFWRDPALPYIELRQVLDGRRVTYAPHSHQQWSIPKPPQDAEFSVSQGLNIKALLCNNGSPF